MFAVPGWSVSAEALKTQRSTPAQPAPNGAPPREQPKTSKKRKRGHGQPNGVNVTSENLADLWEKHIEGKVKSKDRSKVKVEGSENSKNKKKKKRRKNDGPSGDSIGKANSDPTESSNEIEEENGSEVPAFKKAKDTESEIPISVNEHKTPVEAPNGQAAARKPELAGKMKYEERMRKKHEKAAHRVSGKLPPPRPPPAANGVSDHKATSIQPLTQSDDIEDSQQQPATQKTKTKQKSKAKAPPQERPPTPSSPSNDSVLPIMKTSLKTKRPNSNSESSSLRTAPQPSSTSAQLPTTAQTHPSQLSRNLTPLQRTMAQKLLSSRFRHLNQTLYTTPSTSALHLFTTTPTAYTAYHAGFRAQVAVWPQNPVEGFISDLKLRGKVQRMGLGGQKGAWRAEKKGKKNAGNATGGKEAGEALPRTHSICTIADLGCGDAHLAASLSASRDLKLKIHSFDLAKGDGPNKDLITVADITALPLRDGEVDVAICCLSLMGTNWVDAVEEVGRVVRAGGEVWVAEIKSRFQRGARGRRDPKEGIGKMKKKGRGKKGAEDGEEEDDGEGGGVVEVDSDPEVLVAGGKGKRRKGEEETDVGGFVEVWQRRGFEVRGEVDLSNKMFVRMRFEKGRGKPGDRVGGMDGAGKAKFVDEEREEVSKEEEAKVLKPCVYKLR